MIGIREDKWMDQLLHHSEHLILYSVVLWQAGLILYLLLKYLVKRLPKKEIHHIPYGLNGTTSRTTSQQQKTAGTPGVIEVDVEKNIAVGKADSTSIKMDETVKGKVKTQKNKLKELRK